MKNVIAEYLDLMDAQRKTAFASLEGLGEAHIWQRPAPKEWCIAEILDHNVRLFESILPGLQTAWALFAWYGRLRRNRPYPVVVENVYKRPGFPMWTGFLWTPKFNPSKTIPLADLQAESESVHRRAREFYAGKDPDVLGNLYGWDPAIGVVNLIQALKVGIDHDQLHYEDVIELASQLQRAGV
ncbi:MAG: DinB family protein [Chloroflexota bacterium]